MVKKNKFYRFLLLTLVALMLAFTSITASSSLVADVGNGDPAASLYFNSYVDGGNVGNGDPGGGG